MADAIAELPPLMRLGPGWPRASFERAGPPSASSGLVGLPHVAACSDVRVVAVTWNMHGKLPSGDLGALFPPGDAEIYAIGSEECERSIGASLLVQSKGRWLGRLGEALGPDYTRIASHTLAAIHLAVYVHASLLPALSDVRTAAVACGVGNALGNKGGVAVAAAIGKTTFLFVNCHLAAHSRAVARRNADAARIDAQLPLWPADKDGSAPLSPVTALPSVILPAEEGVEEGEDGGEGSDSDEGEEEGESPLPAPAPSSDSAARRPSDSLQPLASPSAASDAGFSAGASSRYDRVVWMGDMNYRVNGSRAVVDALLAGGRHEVLLANDQLLRERREGRAFPGFFEGPLAFRPTYKLDKGGPGYDTGPKARVPAWTDRILFRSNGEAEGGSTVGAYVYPSEERVEAASEGPSPPPDVDRRRPAGPGPPPTLAISGISLTSYAAVECEGVRMSDHLPVVASFVMRLRGDHVRRRTMSEQLLSPVGTSSASFALPTAASAEGSSAGGRESGRPPLPSAHVRTPSSSAPAGALAYFAPHGGKPLPPVGAGGVLAAQAAEDAARAQGAEVREEPALADAGCRGGGGGRGRASAKVAPAGMAVPPDSTRCTLS
jgi:hypothetical protein